MGFIEFMFNFAWRLLAIGFGFMIFRYILRNGTGTLREIFDTLFIGFKAMLIAIRKKLVTYLKKQERREEPKKETNPTMTFDEWEQWCKEHNQLPPLEL